MSMTTPTTSPAWDDYDVYLFDIDGTLLNCTDAVHYFAFCEALTTIAGRPLNLDGVIAHGNTDIGILRDALTLANIPDAQWRPGLTETRKQMCRFVQARVDDLQTTVLPGVIDLLSFLRAQGKVLGVATGNLEEIGRAKLKHTNLLNFFHFGGYSDAHEYRHDVFRAAVKQARRLSGSSAQICVIGDTPEDVRAARANEVDVIAVATGVFSFEILQAEQPTRCIHSLLELLDPATK